MLVQNLVLELTFLRILPFVPAWVINMAAPVRFQSTHPLLMYEFILRTNGHST